MAKTYLLGEDTEQAKFTAKLVCTADVLYCKRPSILTNYCKEISASVTLLQQNQQLPPLNILNFIKQTKQAITKTNHL